MDFALARINMIEGQIRPNKVTDTRLVAAMSDLPREEFLDPGLRHRAYTDEDLVLSPGCLLMEPMTTARLIQAAEIRDGDRALVIASGTGYEALLTALMGATVTAVGCVTEAARRQRFLPLLERYPQARVTLVDGPVLQGWAEGGPYQVIVAVGAVARVPESWVAQLDQAGRLVVVAGLSRGGTGSAMLYQKFGTTVAGRPLFEASCPWLPGLEPEPSFQF